jgi:hypothetical protein
MSKQRILMIVALCFVLIGTVAAGIPHEPKPDSVVTCQGAVTNPMGIYTYTVPASIDSSACAFSPPDQFALCSPCIRSLENQGCEVIDLATEFFALQYTQLPDRSVLQSATFQLSCAGP